MSMHIAAADRDSVEAEIKREETHTSAEIVVVVASQCDDYIHVPLHIAAAVALAVPLLLPMFASWLPWSSMPLRWIFIAQMVVFIVTALVLECEPLRYYVTPRRLMRKYTHRFAAAEFLAVNIHATKGRNGLLIFASLLERHVEIVTDLGIAKRIPDAVWQQIVNEMIPLLRADQLNEALLHGVKRCGKELAQEFPLGRRNPNELPDKVILVDADGKRVRPEDQFGNGE
jgi:putative membrane protein